MSQTFEFYDARAKESAAEATLAVLDNVRDRALRSEKTWRALAEQAKRVLIDREKAEATRHARREAVRCENLAEGSDGADEHDDARSDADEFRDGFGRSLPPMPRERGA